MPVTIRTIIHLNGSNFAASYQVGNKFSSGYSDICGMLGKATNAEKIDNQKVRNCRAF
jgi:hypothetical protein